MLRIMKNNWNRMLEKKGYLISAIVLTMCSVAFAIIITNKVEIRGNIALVDKENTIDTVPYLNITRLQEEPPVSQLMQNRYDAVVIVDQVGELTIRTIKGQVFQTALQNYLQHPSQGFNWKADKRKIGTNIIGYMLMFLLMQGALYARLFAEDKEKHMIERVFLSPIRFSSYLMGQGIFIWLLIVLPTWAVVGVAGLTGVSIGFTLFQYIMIIAVLAFLAVAFGLCINAFFNAPDTANMLASSLIVLTSILAGSFYSYHPKAAFFDRILHMLPQRDLMNFVDAWEKGRLSYHTSLQISYVIAVSVLMIIIAVIKTRREYIYR